jgi:hypothetical protein
MRVVRIVRHVCLPCVALVHAVRLRAVLAVVEAIVSVGRLSVVSIGRAVRGGAFPKHAIKRVDRLLSNGRMYRERSLYFAAMARKLIGSRKRPIVLVDWTKVTEGFHALVAAVPAVGRAVSIYLEVHPERVLGKACVQARFLRRLREVLPAGCTPVIVADAGFHGPFFREVTALGWDFLGRIRSNARLQHLATGVWTGMKELYSRASSVPRDLGRFRLYRTRRRFEASLVLARSPRYGKRHPWIGRRPIQGSPCPKTIRGAKTPWLLVTSLQEPATAVVALYAKRMQIEETFRDIKNPRFGWCLRHVRGHSAQRLTLLLLLAALAMLAVLLIGLAAEADGRHRRYQANTARERVLSLFVLGLAVLQRDDYTGLGRLCPDGFRRIRAVHPHLDG